MDRTKSVVSKVVGRVLEFSSQRSPNSNSTPNPSSLLPTRPPESLTPNQNPIANGTLILTENDNNSSSHSVEESDEIEQTTADNCQPGVARSRDTRPSLEQYADPVTISERIDEVDLI